MLDFVRFIILARLISGDCALGFACTLDLLRLSKAATVPFKSRAPWGATSVVLDLLRFGAGELLRFGAGELLRFGAGELLRFGAGELLRLGAGEST